MAYNEFMNLNYAIALLISAAISLTIAITAWKRRSASPAAIGLVIAMLAQTVWAATYGARWMASEPFAQHSWLDATYFGAAFETTFFLIFTLQFTGHSRFLTRRNLALLAIVPILTLLLLYTDDWHGLFFGGLHNTNLIFDGGPWFRFFMFYSYTQVIIFIGLLFQAYLRTSGVFRWQAGSVLFAAFLPIAGNVLGLIGFSPFPNLDLTPFLFTASGLIYAYALFGLGLLDVAPVARDLLVEKMADGMIVSDSKNRIVDINPAAQQLLGLSASVIGHSSVDVLNTRLHLDQAIDSKAVSLIDIRVSENPPRDIELQVLPLLDTRQNSIGRLLILHDITERKQNELRNQSILQTAMDGFWLADTRGHLLEVNETYCRMSGYSEQELLAMSISDLGTNETPEEMASHIEKIMTQGEDRFESRHRRKDDSFFDTEVSVQYQPGDGGRFIVFLHDITKRKQSEELLNEYLIKLGERAKELNCLYSISEIIKRNDISQADALLECLPVIAQAHQFPEITGCRIILGEYLYSMENFAETPWLQNCAIMIRGEQAGSIEVCYLEERPLVNESPFLFEERALLKTVTNILEKYILRRQVEESLRMEHWRLESIIEATNVGTWEWNIQTGEQVWNEAGAKVLGYTLKELEPISKKTWEMLAHPIDLEQGNKLLKRHFAGELPSYDFECRMKHKDGHWVWIHDRGRVMTRNADGKPLTMFGSITDISERKQSILLLEKIAKTDFLTNLYNRRYFMQRGTEECKRTSRSYQPLTLLMLDIDHFKKVNDTYGHEIGDLALQHVAAIMKSGLREIDILGRMGGEEFAALLPNTSLDHAVLLAERIRLSVGNTPFDTSAQVLTLTVSIGVEMFTNEMSGIDELLRNADAALYRAKNSGRNCVVAYPSP